MPSHPKAADLPALLAKLCDSGIEFIIVGGVAAVLQGAPITTTDLDIVHRRTPANVVRLLDVLRELDAIMRYDMARRNLRPTAEMLAGRGQIRSASSMPGKATTSCCRTASRCAMKGGYSTYSTCRH